MPDKTETKAQKFSRIAGARVKAAKQKIASLGNLGNGGYEFTDAQADKVAKVLHAAVDAAMDEMRGSAAAEDTF